MKAITKRRIISILMIIFVLFSSISVGNVGIVQAASDGSSITVDDLLEGVDESQLTEDDVTGQDVMTEDTTTSNQEDIQEIEPEELAVNAVSGGAITVGNITTWDAEAILAAGEGDNGLTLHGSGWTIDNAMMILNLMMVMQ